MKHLPLSLAASAVVLGVAMVPVHAADMAYEPPAVVEQPPVEVYTVEEESAFGGWYIRGDVDYHWSKLRGITYITYGPPPGTASFVTTNLRGAWSVGGGVGYNITRYLRADLTLDYWSRSRFTGSTTGTCGGVPCTSVDTSGYTALLLLANAYVDLGTWHGITPYVGAGIGGAYVNWDNLYNTAGGTTVIHGGTSGIRFAYALMAGASYCLTSNLELDAGYRFSQITGGRMFEYASGVAPGFDGGINVHEVRAGLRWNLGKGSKRCAPPPQKVVDYIPPVYK